MNPLKRQTIQNDPGDFELWVNEIYVVLDFRGQDAVELRIQTRDGSARHDWREFQQIKNDVCGAKWEAVELYPAESRLTDPSNMFFLWCRPSWSEVGWHRGRNVGIGVGPQRPFKIAGNRLR